MARLFKCRVKRHCRDCRAAPEVPVPAPRGYLRCAAVTRRDNRLQLWEKVHLRMHRFKISEMVLTDEKPPPFQGWHVLASSLLSQVSGLHFWWDLGSIVL